jgi:AraC-like DNA-binding protein
MRVTEEHVTHPDAAFRFLALQLRAFGGPRHRHDQAELTWVVRGHGVRFVGDSAEPFGEGDLVLLGPQLAHRWVGRAAPGEPAFEARVLQFPTALLAHPLCPELRQLQPLLDRAGRGLRVTGRAHAQVSAALRAMDGADSLQRLALLLQLLRTLLLHARSLKPLASVKVRAAPAAPASRAADPGAPGARIDRVIDWIHRHLADELFVDDAARVAHVTPAAFSRFFRRETGKTWTAYVNDVRCSEVASRLMQDTRPVGEVMAACGYRNASHFHRAFAQRFGCTPRAWRQRGR